MFLLVCLKYIQGKEPLLSNDEDDDEEGVLIYPVPQEECDKIQLGMGSKIEFEWNHNRNKFMIPF